MLPIIVAKNKVKDDNRVPTPSIFHFYREIEACDRALESLCGAYNELIKIRGKCQPGILIPSGKYDAIELFNMSDSIDQKPFYGRCMGLHVSVQVAQAI